MPDQFFFLDEGTQLTFVDFCLVSGYYFYADDMRSNADIASITSKHSLVWQIQNWGPLGNHGKFFIGHESYTESPPFVSNVVRSEGEFFFICQKHGGPFLDLSLTRRYETPTGQKLIVGGSLGYYPDYINALGVTTKAPPALSQSFRQLSAFLTKHAIQSRHGRRFLISQPVIDDVDAGWQLAGRITADSSQLHNLL